MPSTLKPAHPESGLALRTANPRDKVALRGVRLLARLAGMSQRVTIEQTFVNLEARPIEAVYTFPLPESAAVCGFEVVTADRTLVGTVEEAEQATEQYEAAVSEGHGGFLMEQDRPDVFTVRVGNLKPRQAATIRLTYVCPLERVDKQIRVAFPTTVAPRYVTATATDPIDAAVDGDALNPPHVLSVPYGLSMRVEVDLGRDLVGCISPSHPVDVAQDGAGRAVVTLAGGGVTEMNRDVVLSLRLDKEQQPCVQAAPGPDGANYLAVTFVPEFDEAELGDPQPTETVFVLDCSGSMMGESIEQAKAALELCLRSLSPGDTFNVCRFGSSFELLASEPLPYTQATLDRGLAYVRQGGDLGGTELHPPLEAILRVPPPRGVVRQVILLTDGQVSNEPAVVELCRKHRKANRVFSFGIGSGCSQFLVKGVARATGGAAEFIAAGERIDEKVLRTFARLASPVVSDVAIDWDGAEVQTLAEIPPVFDGDVLAVFGRAGEDGGAARLPRHVTLSCQVGGGTRSWRVEVPPPLADENVIATMWARRTIQSLEEVNGPAVRSRKQKPTREQETLVRISKQFNLLCSLTTFVSIEHRTEAERTDGQPTSRRVPVTLAKGWGGVDVASRGAFGGAMPQPAMAAPARALGMPSPSPIPCPKASRGGPAQSKKRSRGLLGKLFGSERRKELSAPKADSMPPPAPPAAAPGGIGFYDLSQSLDEAADEQFRGSPADILPGEPYGGGSASAVGGPTPPTPSAPMERSLDRSMYRSIDKTVGSAGGLSRITVAPGEDDGLADDLAEAPIRRLVESMLVDAYDMGADEIHLEPMADRLQLRVRVQGRLEVRDRIPLKMRLLVAKEVRRRAGLDPAAPAGSTGTCRVTIDGAGVEVIVSSLPSTHGDTFVMRLLGPTVGVPKRNPSGVEADRSLSAVLGLQSAEGWFDWTKQVADHVEAVGPDWRPAVEAAMPDSVAPALHRRAVQTVLVLLLLARAFGGSEDLWSRAAKKATHAFLPKALGQPRPEVEAWLETLRRQLVENGSVSGA